MEIKKVVPSGYCKGVIKAINMVKQTIKQYPDKQIYILGMLVHNRYVVDAFNKENVITIEGDKIAAINAIEDGVVVFTAHGIDPKIKQLAIDKGLIVVDATCTDVTKNSLLCKEHLHKEYDIIYIGKNNHPEAEAVLSLSSKIHLVSNLEDIKALNLTNNKVFVTNQTTFSINEIKNLLELIKEKYPQAEIAQEICDATRTRQTAISNLKDIDCVIVVGDPNSNNTAQLANIAKDIGIKKILRVENASQLNLDDLIGCEKVAVTAGASTPSYLTNQLISYLNTKDKKYLEIDLSKILDL